MSEYGFTGITIRNPETDEEEAFYRPHARQLEFHNCPARYRLFGGALGGGKSFSLRMEAYVRSIQFPGHRTLLMRKVMPELKKTHLLELPQELTKLLGLGRKGGLQFKDVYKASDHLVTFPNGSIIQFGSAETDNEVSKYLSTEFDCLLLDESTTFPFYMFRMLSTRIGRRASFPWSIACATNPVGLGASWHKRLWIDKDPDSEEAETYDPSQYVYIPSGMDDNPYLSPDYKAKTIGDIPSQALRDAYIKGSWESLEGQFFSEFKSEKDGQPWHVVREMPKVAGVPVNELPWLEWFRAVDWGINSLAVCGWYCCLPNGRIYKIYEQTWKEFCPGPQMAREIVAFGRKHVSGKVRYTVVDPKMHSREGSLGTPVAEDFTKHGVPNMPADNQRELGWAQFKTWLRTLGDDGLPMLRFYAPGCPHTVRTLPTLVTKKGNPDDIEKGSDDHCADETRYGVMSRPAPTRVRAKADHSITQAAATINPEFRAFLRGRSRGQALDLHAAYRLRSS